MTRHFLVPHPSYSLYCLSYLAAAGRSDWGWACRCHNWHLPPTASPACSWSCTLTAGRRRSWAASYQPRGSAGLLWLMGRQLHAGVHRVSTRQKSCWGEQRRVEGSTADEVEREDGETAVAAGPACTMSRWCHRQAPPWIAKRGLCKMAKASACLVSLQVDDQGLLWKKWVLN